jgi:ribonuclease HI
MELGGNRGQSSSRTTLTFGIKLRYTARMQFNNESKKCTNNIAEYETILLGLHKLGAIEV